MIPNSILPELKTFPSQLVPAVGWLKAEGKGALLTLYLSFLRFYPSLFTRLPFPFSGCSWSRKGWQGTRKPERDWHWVWWCFPPENPNASGSLSLMSSLETSQNSFSGSCLGQSLSWAGFVKSHPNTYSCWYTWGASCIILWHPLEHRGPF